MVQGILHALSDPVRVRIFAQLSAGNCAQNCSAFLTVDDTPLPKSTLSQHFKVLRESGLIRGERHGVEMQNTSRCGEIEKRFPGLIPSIIQALTIQSHHRGGPGEAPKKKPGKVVAKK